MYLYIKIKLIINKISVYSQIYMKREKEIEEVIKGPSRIQYYTVGKTDVLGYDPYYCKLSCIIFGVWCF